MDQHKWTTALSENGSDYGQIIVQVGKKDNFLIICPGSMCTMSTLPIKKQKGGV